MQATSGICPSRISLANDARILPPYLTALLPPYLTSYGTSRPARFSMGSLTQALWTAVGGATCTRSTHGCGSLGSGGLAWGVYLCLRPRTSARPLSVLGQRGVRVKRPVRLGVAAVRQRGAEMNETYGLSTSGRIYQYIPGYANFEILYLHILGYKSLSSGTLVPHDIIYDIMSS